MPFASGKARRKNMKECLCINMRIPKKMYPNKKATLCQTFGHYAFISLLNCSYLIYYYSH